MCDGPGPPGPLPPLPHSADVPPEDLGLSGEAFPGDVGRQSVLFLTEQRRPTAGTILLHFLGDSHAALRNPQGAGEPRARRRSGRRGRRARRSPLSERPAAKSGGVQAQIEGGAATCPPAPATAVACG